MDIHPRVGALKADPEKRTWVLVVHLGGDSRKHSEGLQRTMQEREKNQQRKHQWVVTSMGNWSSVPLETYEEPCGGTAGPSPWWLGRLGT